MEHDILWLFDGYHFHHRGEKRLLVFDVLRFLAYQEIVGCKCWLMLAA